MEITTLKKADVVKNNIEIGIKLYGKADDIKKRRLFAAARI